MVTKLQKASIAIRQNKGRDYSPKWDGAESWTGDKFTAHFRDAMKYYNLESSIKELKPKVIDWMGRNGYSKDQIQSFKKTKDSRCGMTVASVAACLIRGMPEVHKGFNNGKNTTDWLRKEIVEIIEQGKNDIEETAEVKAVKLPSQIVNIQDRIREQAGHQSEEIDAAIDNWIIDPEAFDPKAFRLASLLRGKGVKAAQARYIKAIFQRGHDELMELASGKSDEQLREAYSHVSRKNVKKLIEFYQSIFIACEQIAQEAKTLKKPRAKKIKPAEELVKKLKFKLSEDKLGITSVPGAGIIGAQAAVVYNTKTRRLGVYYANSSVGLNVKGASIIDFTVKSFQKTLRKPETQLREFKEQNTQRRVESWFDKIKATETLLNGRVNGEVILLKIFK